MRRFLTLLLVVAASVALSPIASSNGKDPGAPKRPRRTTTRLSPSEPTVVVCPDPCVECQPCPDLTCAPCPACVCQDASDSKKVEIRYVESSMPAAGQWLLPLTIGWLPSSEERLSWIETPIRREPVDPSFDVEHDPRWLAGVGVAYQWPSRWIFGVQALWLGESDVSARWVEHPSIVTYPEIRRSAPTVRSTGSNWGVALTLTIPIGGAR